MAKGELTLRQETALAHYLKNGNKTEAYRVAYSTKNMKPASVNRKAVELFDKVNIRSRIEEYVRKRKYDADITQERVLEEEKCIAYFDISQMFELKEWTLIHPKNLPEHVRRAIKSIEIKELRVLKGEPQRYKFKYKFWNKDGSLERVSKHLGLYERDNAQKAAVIQINMVQIDKK